MVGKRRKNPIIKIVLFSLAVFFLSSPALILGSGIGPGDGGSGGGSPSPGHDGEGGLGNGGSDGGLGRSYESERTDNAIKEWKESLDENEEEISSKESEGEFPPDSSTVNTNGASQASAYREGRFVAGTELTSRSFPDAFQDFFGKDAAERLLTRVKVFEGKVAVESRGHPGATQVVIARKGDLVTALWDVPPRIIREG